MNFIKSLFETIFNWLINLFIHIIDYFVMIFDNIDISYYVCIIILFTWIPISIIIGLIINSES